MTQINARRRRPIPGLCTSFCTPFAGRSSGPRRSPANRRASCRRHVGALAEQRERNQREESRPTKTNAGNRVSGARAPLFVPTILRASTRTWPRARRRSRQDGSHAVVPGVDETPPALGRRAANFSHTAGSRCGRRWRDVAGRDIEREECAQPARFDERVRWIGKVAITHEPSLRGRPVVRWRRGQFGVGGGHAVRPDRDRSRDPSLCGVAGERSPSPVTTAASHTSRRRRSGIASATRGIMTPPSCGRPARRRTTLERDHVASR